MPTKEETVSPWIFKDLPYNPDVVPDEFFAFVYIIENTETGKKYIGKKRFWFKGKKTVTLKNGKKKKKSILVESDWRDYFGSSKEFTEEVERNGKDKYTRIILHLCKSNAESSYLEAQEQFDRRVLFDSSYANAWIMCRIRRNHVKGLFGSTDGKV